MNIVRKKIHTEWATDGLERSKTFAKDEVNGI